MAFLTLNGIVLPVAAGEASEADDSMYLGARSVNGVYVEDVVATRRRWDLTTPLLSRDEARALKGLLLGEGQSWSFDVDLYSDAKGAPPATTANLSLAASTPSPKFGAKRLAVSTATSTYWVESLPAWTVGVWWWDSSAWVHRLQTSNGTKWEDGVQGSYAWSLAPSGANFQLAVGAWDDLVLLPYALPDDMGDQWPLTEAWTPLPHLTLSGDLADGASYVVQAERGSFDIEPAQAVIGGVFTTGKIISCTLKEV